MTFFFLSLPNTDRYVTGGRQGSGFGFATVLLGDCADDILWCQCVCTIVLPSFHRGVKCHPRELHLTGLLISFLSPDSCTLFFSWVYCSKEFWNMPGFSKYDIGSAPPCRFDLSVFHVKHLNDGLCVFTFSLLICLCSQVASSPQQVTVLTSPACTMYCPFKSSSPCNIDSSPLTVSQLRINP